MKFNHLHKYLYRRRVGLLLFFFILICLFCLEGYSEGADLFSAQSLIVEGKKLCVIPTDLDGRGLFEIVVVSKTGVYPKNQDGDLFSKPLTQSDVFTSPYMHIVDLNGDSRDDLLFYEKKTDGKISLLLNTGEWKDVPTLEKKSMSSDGK